MRVSAIAILVLVVVSCMIASGTQRDGVLIYFTVGTEGDAGGTQLWRCFRDGTGAQLLHQYAYGGYVRNLTVDTETQRLLFVKDHCLYTADLDCSNLQALYCNSYYGPPGLASNGAIPVDAERGYICWVESGSHIHSARSDGSDDQEFYVADVPGMVLYAVVADVGLLVEPASSVELTSWGRIKSRFR